MTEVPQSIVWANLPRTSASLVPLKWYAGTTVSSVVKKTFGRLFSRAVGSYQRTKWMTLSLFLASDLTVKDLQINLGLRRPGLVGDYFFKYKRSEEAAWYFIDLVANEGLDCDIHFSTAPTRNHPDFEKAEAISLKIFDADADFSDIEISYILTGKTLYWPIKKWVQPAYWLA